jgi:hypothetical protein
VEVDIVLIFEWIVLQMSTSGGGGYCDCGDKEAWKTAAFCDIHVQGLETQQDHVSIFVPSRKHLICFG